MKLPPLSLIAVPLIAIAFAAIAGDRGPLHVLRLAERLARRHMLALRIVQAGWMFTR